MQLFTITVAVIVVMVLYVTLWVFFQTDELLTEFYTI